MKALVFKRYGKPDQVTFMDVSQPVPKADEILVQVHAAGLNPIDNMISMSRKRLAPVHPGEVLFHEFIEPLQMSQYRLAKSLKVPARRINEIVHCTRGISADTALRLSRFFGTSDRFWLNLQTAYDLDVERDRIGDEIIREVPIFRQAS